MVIERNGHKFMAREYLVYTFDIETTDFQKSCISKTDDRRAKLTKI